MILTALALALIATSPSEGASEPLLLDFHASWCGPCKTMRPHVERLAQAGYPIKSVDIDASPELAKRYKITGVPAFVVIDGDGKEMARSTGAQPPAEIAEMYRKVQAKLQAGANDRRALATSEGRSRPASARTIPASGTDDDPASDDAKTERELRDDQQSPENPKPWETVVRIKMHLSAQEIGYGSGTIIYSSAGESLILTCAHIFKLSNQATPPASQFPVRIDVDLFDGRLTRQTVHYVETVRGEAVDYDFVNDVGLIRIRPGRRLPAATVVPMTWTPSVGMNMITVGCSEGHDATAWDTKILRANVGMQHVGGGQKVPFSVLECEYAPRHGRSGGGLFTPDGYVAGVCDFADTNASRGLYATPRSIYRILDKNRLTALYRPETKGDERLLADNGASTPRRGNTKARGQTPPESGRAKITLPEPALMGIPELKVALGTPESKPVASKSAYTWQTRSATPAGGSDLDAKSEKGAGAVTAGMVMDPSPADFDRRPDPEGDDLDPKGFDPVLKPSGNAKWKPIKRSSD